VSVETLGELLRQRALEKGASIAYAVLDDTASMRETVSYEQLHRAALRVAGALQRRFERHTRIALAYPNGIGFITAFFGCALSGMIALPLAAPKRNRKNERFKSIVRDALPAGVLTLEGWEDLLRTEIREAGGSCEVYSIDDDEFTHNGPLEHTVTAPHDVAYLQYTSGSIGAPKGVMVTHANVLRNSAFMQYVEENDEESVSLTWLPNFHDMGLAEGLLQPMFSGVPGLIMTPAAFLGRPLLWLQAISRHRVTNSGGPNFAYDLCVEKMGGAEATPLDLSCWRVAYNGAEPIRHITLKRFLETFSPFGFKEQAFYPVYGLAEATLLVTSGRRQDLPFRLTVDRENLERGQAVAVAEGANNSYTLVASGLVLRGRHEHAPEVVIVDPASGDLLPDGAVGEVDLRGTGVALGYWNRPDETRETFAVPVRGRPGAKFARTGDLGFIWEGRLFLTGRIKDLIITKGRNLYPHDVEWLAETAHEAIRPSGCAAFSLNAEEEDRIVVVCEVARKYLRRDLLGAAEAVRERVSTELEIELYDVVLIPPLALPKTSSGKVQRLVCRDMLNRGEFAVILSLRKANTAQAEAPHGANGIREELTALLNRGRAPVPIPDDAPIFQYVNDSLHAVQLCHEVERRYGVAVPVSCFLGRSSLSDLLNSIASRLAQTGDAGAQSRDPIPQAAHSGLVRLSYTQEALWFLAAVAPESVAYHISRVLQIDGDLDVTALRRALDLLAARHAALRTRFEIVDGVPHQAFNSSKTISFECEDGAGFDNHQATQHLAGQAFQPFHLESDSLFRFHLLRCGKDRHLLLISIHHIVADLGSFAQLLDELLAHYEALVSGQWPQLPPPAHDYAGFVRWQRELRSSAEGRAWAAHWKESVRALPRETALPLDRPRPRRQSFRGAWIEHDIDEAVTVRLERFAQDGGTTPFCVLLATYLVFLHRATGQATVGVGVPVSGRNRQQFAGTLGFLSNAIVVSSEISPASSWRDVLLRTSAQMGSALDAGEYPFPLIVEDSGVERDPRFSPLFQQMFSLESSPRLDELAPLSLGRSGGHLERANLTLTAFALPQQGAQFDLHAMFARHHGRLLGNWNFNSDLLDEGTVRGWARAYTSLLREALGDPDRAVAEMLVYGSDDRGLQGERMDLPAGALTLHGLIERQARQSPDRIAVSFEGNFLTYEKLDRAAGTIARALRRRGVGTDDRVGICMDRSLELPVALLGILKSGAAYLPIATDYPQRRIEQALADARPKVVITSQEHRDKFGDSAVALSELLQEGDGGSRATAPASSADSAAYVIFTSGSSGSPKGAVNSHLGIVNRLLWMQREYGLNPDDHVLQKTPYTFDVSVWEFFWPLLSGAQLIVCEPGAHRDPLYLQRLIAQREVTVLHFVPSMLALFSEQADRESVRSVHELFCSGEVLPRAVETAAFGLFGGAIHNLYGPTEAAVDVSAWRCAPEDRGATVPIGRPIANITIRILDHRMRPVIPGAAGNLYIAGLGLARGYIGQPDLTASSFVPDPYAERPGSRLYSTGDQARVRGDLAIEFLGRGDFQVKVRGFRVELADIEAQLQAHPGIVAVAVTSRNDGRFGTRLTAYYVARTGSRESSRSLRTWLAARLPDYMIPAFFVELPALPMLESGKVDRKGLPQPTGTDAPESGMIAPRTGDELVLAEVWKEVLGVESISVTHTFFELGGDSLLIVRATAKARERGLNITAECIYQCQTIEKICAQPRGAAAEHEQAPYTEFSLLDPAEAKRLPGDLQDAMPLARLQETLVYHIENYENYIAYVASVHLRAPFRLELWEQSIDAAMARHPYLRTSFALKDFQDPLQFVHRAVRRPLFLNDIRHLSAEAQEQYLAQWLSSEKKRRFEWDAAPFFRLTIHRRTEDTFQLTLTEVMLDGWSMAVVLAELCRSYRSLLQGRPLEPGPPDPSYGRFVQLEREAAKNRASEEFWQTMLTGGAVAGLPRWPAKWRSADRSLHSRRTVHIAADMVQRLKECAREAGCPLKSVFLAAHFAVLRTLTGRDEVLTELIVHGRPEEAGGDSAVGLYINTVPVQLGLRGMSWIDLVRQAARSEVELYPHRRYPFFEIRRLSRHPLLDEAAFNFTHFHTHKDLLPGDRYLEVLDVQAFDQTYFSLTAYFNLLPVDNRLSIDLDYNPTELADEQIALMAGYYEKALQTMAASPASKLAGTSLMSASELARELSEWSVAQPLAAEPPELLDIIYNYCRKSPDRVAIVQDGAALTYGELRRRSAALSARLAELGIGPEVGVGVLLERSPAFVVALMAILDSGGFFVPLDPCDPPERRALVVRQSGVRAIIVKESGANAGEVVEVSCEEACSTGPRRVFPHRPAPPEALAYCIYTSGSTGEPKGVQVPRSALASFIPAAAEAYRLDADDGVLQFASLCFDVAIEEIFCTLWTGGRLVLRTEETLDSFDSFLSACARDQLTFLDLPTAFWHQLTTVLKEGESRLPPAVKTVVTVGEKAIARRLADWREAVGTGVQVYNAYGPTEATIVSVLHRVEAADPVEEEFPIGRPLAGMTGFILGADEQAGPVGRIGELCLGGRRLARGYRERGDLTAERFRPNPFGPEQGSRLYWTGDFVKRRPDGCIDFIGRKDAQIKIRGFRVELGEIESALYADERVKQAAVVASNQDESGTPVLVAYVTPKQWIPEDTGQLAEQLSSELRRKLPAYMVPARIEVTPSLALTRSGKVNKSGLGLAPPAARKLAALAEPTLGPVETTLCAIYRACLGIEEVPRTARFADLGGHSLSAMKIVSRIQEKLHVNLKVRDVFDAPGVAALAERLEQARRLNGSVRGEDEPIRRAAPDQKLEMSFAQERLWFLHQFDTANTSYNVPAAFWIRGSLNVAALHQAFAEICRRHQVLQMRFADRGASAEPVLPSRFVLPLTLIDLRMLSRSERQTMAKQIGLREAARAFDLKNDNLIRIALVELEAEEFLLVVVMHHIVTDEWCTEIFMDEFRRFYQAAIEGVPPCMPELPIQYSDFARWQKAVMSGERLAAQQQFWRRELAGAPPVLQLPLDAPRERAGPSRAGRLYFEIERRVTQGIRSLGGTQDASLFMVLLALYQVLLHSVSDTEDIVVGSPIAGRVSPDTERLVGFFANLLALRSRICPTATFAAHLAEVREMALSCYDHQELSFAQLVACINPERSSSYSPIVQVIFGMWPQSLREMCVDGLRLQQEQIYPQQAKYDLEMQIADSGEVLRGFLEYNAALFRRETIVELVAAYQRLCEAVVDRPGATLSGLRQNVREQMVCHG